MNNILTVFKKELRRYFTDRRMVISLFLPGLLIFVIYSLMGTFISDNLTTPMDYSYHVCVINDVEEFDAFFNSESLHIEKEIIKAEDLDDKINELGDGVDLIVIYDTDFLKKVEDYKIGDEETPKIEMYYNSAIKESSSIYSIYQEVYTLFENSISNKFDINPRVDITYDQATDSDFSVMMITMLLPFLLLTFLFTGAMAITPDSIAGEKERGTIATLLVTQIKRSELAIAKVLSLSVISLASAVVSFLGILFSLPKLLALNQMDLSMYGASTYALIFVVIIVTVLFFVALLSLVSAFAKSIKEATSYGSVVMIIVMMCGATSMMGVSGSSPLLFLVPIYGNVGLLSEIFSLSISSTHALLCIFSNIIYIVFIIFILTKMFKSEKIMFSK